jgi:hypothetical protein
MALVQRLDQVEGAVLVGVQASRAATAVDRYSRQLAIDPSDLQAAELCKSLIDQSLAGEPAAAPRASINHLTSTGLALLSKRSAPQLDENEKALFELISKWLGRIIEGQRVEEDPERTRGDLEEVRDFLAAVSEIAGTQAHDLGEPSLPGSRWISAASTSS